MERYPAPVQTPVLQLGLGRDGRGASLDTGGEPSLGRLSGSELHTLPDRLGRLLAAPKGLLTSAADTEATRRERHAARALATLLSGRGMAELRGRLGELRAQAEQRRERLRLLVDARTGALRAVPWELLECLPAGEWVGAGARLARLQAHAPLAPPRHGGRLVVHVWTPTPDDPTCLAVLDQLRGSVRGLELELVELDDLDALPPAEAGVFSVLHVVSHGTAPVEALGEARAGRGLVWLDVCGAASAPLPDREAAAWRLAAASTPAVLSPGTRLAHDASSRFSEGLYASLAAREHLIDAVAEGRRRMRKLAVAHPSCRWWNLRLVVGSREVLDGPPPLRAADRPAGWPPSSSAMIHALTRAGEEARARGWFGVEQLLGAVLCMAGDTPRLRAARPQLAEVHRRLPPHMGVGGDAAPSPRVREMASRLPSGWDLDDLLAGLASVPWVRRELSDALLEQLGAAASDDRPPTRGLLLEVWGGPEDGRQLLLDTPGQLVGRADPQRRGTAIELYRPGGPTDLALSRHALVWRGRRRADLPAGGRLERGREAIRRVRDDVEVRPGDVIWLGEATRLWVRSTPS